MFMNSKTRALKSKVVNKVSDVLSAPARLMHGIKAKKFENEANVLKEARRYDNAPNFDKGKPTDAFKVRTMADAIKSKYLKK